ncbi:MAG: hypothetical protein FJ125_10835 [Deltaproteobacteria bacterium]|nr:hypothetical protein [Deltaproteobacteria bacterium]
MRIVALADTHMQHEELHLPPGDLLIVAGDLCCWGELPEVAAALGWLYRAPHRTKVLVAGNHDWPFQRERARTLALLPPDVVYLEDGAATVDGLRLWGSPWQPEFGSWAFNLPRGRPLAEKWSLIPPAIDVLVTHGPPAGFGDRAWRGRSTGCSSLRARVDELRPKLHLFGHIHEDGGVWEAGGTLYANVTVWEGERSPTVFDVDQARGTVRAVKVPPARRR